MARPGPGRIKDALGKLFMKIHPDLLWAAPERRRVNEASMQGLNEILAWEKALRQGQLQPPPQTRRVEFYSRDSDKESDAGPPRVITAEFQLPKAFTLDPHSVPDASRAVNAFLSQLLVRGEVLGHKEQEALSDADAHLKKWKEMSQATKLEREEGGKGSVKVAEVTRPLEGDGAPRWVGEREEAKRLKKFEAMGDFGAAFDGMDMEVPEGAHEDSEMPDPRFDSDTVDVPPVQPLKRVVKKKDRAVLGHLAEDFTTMMKEFWKKEDIPDVSELIAADLVHFDQSLSPIDCAKAVESLGNNLPDLRYDLWYFVPIYITERFGMNIDLDGFMSIPYWFTTEEFLKFVSENEALIREAQEMAYRGAKSFEDAVNTARTSAGLADLVVRCNLDDAKSAASLLAECAPVMRDHGWAGMVVELIDKDWPYGARDTGVLQIPADFTSEGLLEFCEYLRDTDQLEMVRDAYTATITSLSEIDRLMNVCYEVIGPASIDVEPEGYTMEHKLQFIKELYAVSGELSRYDWSDYSFEMGPLDLNWESGVLSLPHNFHGPNFAQTVHMLHEEDQKHYGEKEPENLDHLALDLEARRIRAELISTGLLELDPEKQTEQQKTLLRMVETYSGEDDIQAYIKESFPNYLEQHEAHTAVSTELLAQLRGKESSYTSRKLRHYHKNKKRPRIGNNLHDWDFI